MPATRESVGCLIFVGRMTYARGQRSLDGNSGKVLAFGAGLQRTLEQAVAMGARAAQMR